MVQPTAHLGHLIYLLFLGYKPVQDVSVPDTVGNGNTMAFVYLSISKHRIVTIKIQYER